MLAYQELSVQLIQPFGTYKCKSPGHQTQVGKEHSLGSSAKTGKLEVKTGVLDVCKSSGDIEPGRGRTQKWSPPAGARQRAKRQHLPASVPGDYSSRPLDVY